MGIKIIFIFGMFVLAGGFAWFSANVIYLGIKEFFRKRNGETKNVQTNKKNNKNN